MHRPIDEQVIVVTGASSGVGRAIARACGARGAHVGLIARNEQALEVAADEIRQRGGQPLVLPLDVADAVAVDQAAASVGAQWGRIDTWINSAMATVFAPAIAMEPAEIRRVTEVTYLGTVYGTLAALRRMRPHDTGQIIQVGSALAYRSIPLQSAYCAAKAAVRGFTDALRTELMHDGSQITLSMLQLPAVNTPQATRQRNKLPKQAQPVPPMFTPESIAEQVVWAIEHLPREMLIGAPTVRAVWGQKLAPALLDRYLGKKGWDSQLVDIPHDPHAPDILFETLPGDPGAHGPYTTRERGPDWQMRLRSHPAVLPSLAGIAGVSALALARRR